MVAKGIKMEEHFSKIIGHLNRKKPIKTRPKFIMEGIIYQKYHMMGKLLLVTRNYLVLFWMME